MNRIKSIILSISFLAIIFGGCGPMYMPHHYTNHKTNCSGFMVHLRGEKYPTMDFRRGMFRSQGTFCVIGINGNEGYVFDDDCDGTADTMKLNGEKTKVSPYQKQRYERIYKSTGMRDRVRQYHVVRKGLNCLG